MNALAASQIGAGLAVGLGTIGAGVGIGLCVLGALNGLARNPEMGGDLRTNMILGIVFCESIAIYALVGFLLLKFLAPTSG